MRLKSTFSTFKLATFILLLALGAGVAGAQSSDTAAKGQLAGTYEVNGVNRDGSKYSGTLTIEQDAGNRLYLDWRVGDPSYQGMAAVVGTSLYAVWGSDESKCFVVLFELQADGALEGFWFRPLDRNLDRGQEKAVPVGDAKTGEIFAAYTVEGTAPDGSSYSRELQVSHLGGQFYRFRWSGEEVLEGIGELIDDHIQIIASFADHDGECGRSKIERYEDGVLYGTWNMLDDSYSTPGTETAVPIK
jgi:hypothetical protein